MLGKQFVNEIETTLDVPIDATSEDYEVALVEAFLPLAHSSKLEESDVRMIWKVYRHWLDKNNFSGKVEIKETDHDYVFVKEILPQKFPRIKFRSLKYLRDRVNGYLKDSFPEHQMRHIPQLRDEERGFLSIDIAQKITEEEGTLYGIPVLGGDVGKALGYDGDGDIEQFFQEEFGNTFTLSKPINLVLDRNFLEINLDAIKGLVPRREDLKVLRFLPRQLKNNMTHTHYNFWKNPIYCPMVNKFHKQFRIDIKDNEGDDERFHYGGSIIVLHVRKING